MPAFTVLDATHDPNRECWVDSANEPDGDFPIQNLPLCRFRNAGAHAWSLGVGIGDQVLDLRAAGIVDHADMRELLRMAPTARAQLRRTLSDGLTRGSSKASAWRKALHPMHQVQLDLPCEIGGYTDFYVGIHHATAVGRLFRPDQPLLPNYKWVPIGYHGRASTVVVSGTDFHRPNGQLMGAGQTAPSLAPTQRLDFELEMGLVVGVPNAMGEPVALAQAESHIAGLTLFNDWSARDIQAWEYQPLGPFLAKSFASTMSPWIVTLEALAPFRVPFVRDPQDPQPLPYLDHADNRSHGAFDVDLTVRLQTRGMRDAGLPAVAISRSNFAEAAYWTPAQLLAHHTVNGCGLSEGDLLGTGTLSGRTPERAGSMLELTQGGKQPITLPNGETRSFLLDGDTLTLTGRCARSGYRSIGFGECTATVLPAKQL